jgi:hypothetical protein
LDPEITKRLQVGYTKRNKEADNDNISAESLISGLLVDILDAGEKEKILSLAEVAFSYMDADDFRRRFTDGRMGSNPGLSTEKDGKLLLDTAVKSVVSSFKLFLACNTTS